MNDTYALITGAGSGIGKAMACELAERGRNVLLVSKPGEDIHLLSESIKSRYQVKAQSLEMDLLEPEQPEKIYAWITRNHYRVDMLINNAGIGGSGYFSTIPLDIYHKMIGINMVVPVILTRLLLPELKSHKKAFVNFVGSISSYRPMPLKAVYASSKRFLYSFALALHKELRSSSVRVSIGLPGPTLTNSRIQKEFEAQGRFVQHWGFHNPDEVGQKLVRGILNERFLIIPGFKFKINAFILKSIPRSLSFMISGRLLQKSVDNG